MPAIGTLDSQLNTAWSAGQGSSSKVPVPYLIAINGRNYLEDLEFKPWKRQAMRATTTQTTRTQADTSNEPGEQSLSTESLWRRTQDSWHLGAGQVYLDRKNSQEFSYRTSKGIDPWVQWQLGLLNDTTHSLTSSATNLGLVTCGSTVYAIDGQALKFSTDLSSWTTVTGTPAVTASSICTDGHTVYVAYGASGVYSTTEGNAAATQYVTSAIGSAAVLRFVLGRLMLGDGGTIYNVIATGALPTALFTSNYSNFVWKDFAEGNGVIFACGNNGNIGVVYSIQINTDATTLAAPIVCGQLPTGETVNAIYGYAGSGVTVGTSLGWRFAEQSLANGVAGTVSLTIGPLFVMPSPVLAFAGYGRFIYGTYQNYDGTSTGLFRMDPSQFVSDLAPAFASDLMATTQGAVNAITILGARVVFSVSGHGVYAEDTSHFVASGTIDSGFITYSLVDNKMPVFVDNQFLALPSGTSIKTSVSLNGGAFTTLGTIAQTNATFVEWNTPQTLSQAIEVRQLLTAGQSQTVAPTLLRHTLRSVPAPPVPTDWTVVIQLREVCKTRDIEFHMVPSAEYAYLDTIRANKVISTLQVGNNGPYPVTIETIDYIPEQVGRTTGELNGVAVITARTVV
jgi:hypothetical protein